MQRLAAPTTFFSAIAEDMVIDDAYGYFTMVNAALQGLGLAPIQTGSDYPTVAHLIAQYDAVAEPLLIHLVVAWVTFKSVAYVCNAARYNRDTLLDRIIEDVTGVKPTPPAPQGSAGG